MGKYILQNRWMPGGRSLYYYGLRNKENLFRNRVKLSRKQAEIVRPLPQKLSDSEKKTLGTLLGEQIVPIEERKRSLPLCRRLTFV